MIHYATPSVTKTIKQLTPLNKEKPLLLFYFVPVLLGRLCALQGAEKKLCEYYLPNRQAEYCVSFSSSSRFLHPGTVNIISPDSTVPRLFTSAVFNLRQACEPTKGCVIELWC